MESSDNAALSEQPKTFADWLETYRSALVADLDRLAEDAGAVDGCGPLFKRIATSEKNVNVLIDSLLVVARSLDDEWDKIVELMKAHGIGAAVIALDEMRRKQPKGDVPPV